MGEQDGSELQPEHVLTSGPQSAVGVFVGVQLGIGEDMAPSIGGGVGVGLDCARTLAVTAQKTQRRQTRRESEGGADEGVVWLSKDQRKANWPNELLPNDEAGPI